MTLKDIASSEVGRHDSTEKSFSSRLYKTCREVGEHDLASLEDVEHESKEKISQHGCGKPR